MTNEELHKRVESLAEHQRKLIEERNQLSERIKQIDADINFAAGQATAYQEMAQLLSAPAQGASDDM